MFYFKAQKLALTVAQSFSIAYEVSNTKKNENMVEEDYEEPTFSGSNRENKYVYMIYTRGDEPIHFRGLLG